jgi:hypothetical protein
VECVQRACQVSRPMHNINIQHAPVLSYILLVLIYTPDQVSPSNDCAEDWACCS